MNPLSETMSSDETLKFFFKLIDMGKFMADELLPKLATTASPTTLSNISKACDDISCSFQCLSKLCQLIEKGVLNSLLEENQKNVNIGNDGNLSRHQSRSSICSRQGRQDKKKVVGGVQFMGVTICPAYVKLCSIRSEGQGYIYCLPCDAYFLVESEWNNHSKIPRHVGKINSKGFSNVACICTHCDFVTIASKQISVNYTKYHAHFCHQIEPKQFAPVKDFRIVVDRNRTKTFTSFFPKDGSIQIDDQNGDTCSVGRPFLLKNQKACSLQSLNNEDSTNDQRNIDNNEDSTNDQRNIDNNELNDDWLDDNLDDSASQVSEMSKQEDSDDNSTQFDLGATSSRSSQASNSKSSQSIEMKHLDEMVKVYLAEMFKVKLPSSLT